MGANAKRRPTPPAKRAALELRLYVAGNAPNSRLAIANAKAICETHFASAHALEVVDLLVEPLRALADGIVVTPTLLRVWPEPVLRVIGNLNDPDKVLLMLNNT